MLNPMSSPKILATISLSATLWLSATGAAQSALFSGTSSGSWILPEGTFGADLLNANGGTNNRVEWGVSLDSSEANNSIQYDGLYFDVDANNPFEIGDLTYHNGNVLITSHNLNGDFNLATSVSFTNPVTNTEIFNYTFNILQTPNETGDPILDADSIHFAANGFTTNTFNFDGVDYTLQLLGFSNDGGNTILSEYSLPEYATSNPRLYAQITAAPNAVSVPEPSTILGLGVLGIFAATSRAKKR